MKDVVGRGLTKNEVDAMRKLVKEEMESAVDLIVPMVVEMEFAENWLEAH